MEFECHITLECKRRKDRLAFRKELQSFCFNFEWKLSETAGDPVLGDGHWFYLTKHGDDYDELKDQMDDARFLLEENVVRTKIEATVYDSLKEGK